MKRMIAILTLAAGLLVAACGPATTSPGSSVESLSPVESLPDVSTAPLDSSSPSTVP